MPKNDPFSRWIKRKKGRLYGVLGPPKEGDLDPKIDDFGHFGPFLAHFIRDLAYADPPKRGQKVPFWGLFFTFPGGYPGFGKKGPWITAIYRGTFRVLQEKWPSKSIFGGGCPQNLRFSVILTEKRVLSSNKHKEIAFAPYWYISCLFMYAQCNGTRTQKFRNFYCNWTGMGCRETG